MERLRKSFRRKKQKQMEEDEVEDEMERDELESKSVFVDDPVDDTEEEDEVRTEQVQHPTRLQRLRKSIRFSKSKKKLAEENELSDVPEESAEKVGLEIEKRQTSKMSKLRKSLRIKKKDKEKKDEQDGEDKKVKKEKKPSKWETDDEKVRNNHCEFKVKYLGSIEVQESRGMEVCESAIKILKTQSTNKKKLQAILHVSGDGLRVVDKKTQGMLVDQVIEKVSFCAPDRNFSRGFAYISRDGTSRRWVCHGFLARRDSGERLSHAVGVAFAVCLERKQTREREGVSGTWDEDSGAFTRFGSFRQGTLTERLADPQEFKVTPLKVDLALGVKEENPFAIQRPRAGEIGARSSLRGLQGPGAVPSLGAIKGQSPFKRGSEQYTSLRPQDLPSNIQRREKSRVSLILEETFDNEETKNEINAMIIMMAEKTKLDSTPEGVEERVLEAAWAPAAGPPTSASAPALASETASSPEIETNNTYNNTVTSTMVVDTNHTNNNDTEFKPPTTSPETSPNPWDLVPDQPRLKLGHSRTNSSSNPADRWLASLTSKVGDLGPATQTTGSDPLEQEWVAIANRNQQVKEAQTNPFRACV